jgi:hypothetical protein
LLLCRFLVSLSARDHFPAWHQVCTQTQTRNYNMILN